MGAGAGIKKEIKLTEREYKQIEFQRELVFGQLVVYLKNGEPIRLENIKQSVIL